MIVTAWRSGGLAGHRERLGPVDTERQSGAVASAIAHLVREAGFFALPASVGEAGSPDAFRFRLRVEDGDREHEVSWSERSDDPVAVRLGELIDALRRGGFDFEDDPTTSEGFVMNTRDWSAWYNREPGPDGPDPNLHVTGVCELESSSHTVRLEPVPDGVVDERSVQTFQLVVDRPDVGDARATEKEVEWQGDVGPDISTVRIRIPDGQDVSVTVTIAE